MQSQVISETYNIVQADVLYVAQQVLADLHSISNAYRHILSLDRAMNYFNSISTFLYNNAISELGFTIHDPLANNLVYHEYQYAILYGDAVRSFNPKGAAVGRGGKPVSPVQLPSSATFNAWVIWSTIMLSLSEWEQQNIVSATEWDIPSRCPSFNRRFVGGAWEDLGFYGRGYLGAKGKEFRKTS